MNHPQLEFDMLTFTQLYGPLMPSEGRYWLVLALLLTVVVAGFAADGHDADPLVGAGGDQSSEPKALFESAFIHADELTAIEGIRRTTLEHDGETIVQESLRVQERPYVYYRHEVLDANESDRVGEMYVSNASGSWWYYPDENDVIAYEPDEPYNDEAVRADRAAQADRQTELYDLEYRGTETVADREGHRLEVTARNESVVAGISLFIGDTELLWSAATTDPADELQVIEQTLVIDAEYDYPLAERLVFADEQGERYVLTERYETVSFNPDLGDDEFAFDPPSNATVEHR